jgi:hypothetical protein
MMKPNEILEKLERDGAVTCSIIEAGQVLGVSKNSAYAAARADEIRTIQIGQLRRVPLAWLKQQVGVAA